MPWHNISEKRDNESFMKVKLANVIFHALERGQNQHCGAPFYVI
jgi:hypothetical protein